MQDLKTIRKLMGYLSSYDCVTFFSFIETLIAAASPSTVFKSDPSSPWLLLDAAQVAIATARKRVYKKALKGSDRGTNGMEPVLERQPKWKILLDILREIHEERVDMDQDGKFCAC